MGSILGALPSLLALVLELIKWLKGVNQRDAAKEIAQITEAIRQVRGAKNADDKKAAARALSRIINRM